MKILSALVAVISIFDLFAAFLSPAVKPDWGFGFDGWMLALGIVGLLCAAVTFASSRIATFLKVLITIFAVETGFFGALTALNKFGLLHETVRNFLPPESFAIGAAIFALLVYGASHLAIVQTIMRIADYYFVSRERTTARIWPLPRFSTSNRSIAIAMMVFLVLINQAEVGISVRINFFTADFINALNQKNQAAFWQQLLLVFTPWALILISALVLEYIVKSNLIIRWRQYLTRHYIDRWLNGATHYRMSLSGSGTDNPDQRIAEDINQFLDVSEGLNAQQWGVYTFTIQLIATISSLVAFSVILWTLSSRFTLPGTNIVIPGFLFWAALIYSAVGTFGAHMIGRVLTPLYFEKQRFEADFRYTLVRVRESSEQIALLKGEASERATLMGRFGAVVRNYLQIIGRAKWLIAFQNFFAQISVIIPYLLAAPFYFLGKITFGVLSQTAHAFGNVQSSLSFFVDYYVKLASFRAVLARLQSFDAAMDRADAIGRSQALQPQPTPRGSPLEIENLRLDLPDGRNLIENGRFAFAPRIPVLIEGPSGAGKSTLMRAVAGIWPYGTGDLKVPEEARTMLLPQRPYIPVGPLSTVLAYPAASDAYEDAALRNVLTVVGLDSLGERLHEDENWPQALSGGELQRVALARALLIKPDWLFLDEATSALDEAAEARLYEAIHAHLPDTTVVSIGHRTALRQFHERRIELQAAVDGTHTPVELAVAAE